MTTEMILKQKIAELETENAKLVEALKRLRRAFYEDGTSKALRAAFVGTKELIDQIENGLAWGYLGRIGLQSAERNHVWHGEKSSILCLST